MFYLKALQSQIKIPNSVSPITGNYDTLTGYYLVEEGGYLVFSSTGVTIETDGEYAIQANTAFSGTGFKGKYHVLDPKGEDLGLKTYELGIQIVLLIPILAI